MTRVNEVMFAVVFLRFATVGAPEKDVDDDGRATAIAQRFPG